MPIKLKFDQKLRNFLHKIYNFCKMDKVKGLNSYHRVAIKSHLRSLQRRMYRITEHDETLGKFGDYQEILNNIVKYSNEYFKYTKADRSKEEWLYMIPTYSMYATIGFISGMRNDDIEKIVDLEKEEEEVVSSTLNIVGHLTDVLQEHNERIEYNRMRDPVEPKD